MRKTLNLTLEQRHIDAAVERALDFDDICTTCPIAQVLKPIIKGPYLVAFQTVISGVIGNSGTTIGELSKEVLTVTWECSDKWSLLKTPINFTLSIEEEYINEQTA